MTAYPPRRLDERDDTTFDKEADELEDMLPDSPRQSRAIDFKALRNAPRRPTSNLAITALVALLICLGYLVAYGFTSLTRYGHTQKLNVILCISDGMGPASETFAREFVQYLHQSDHPLARAGGRFEFPAGFGGKLGVGQGGFGTLPLDALLVGQSRTRSSNSLVTDSAAGATAFSCAQKTYNGAIAVEPEHRQPCATILEAAKHKGYLTGLVATSRLTHATPAAFFAHVVDRDMETEIADMLVAQHPLGLSVDYALGGGRCFFLPNTTTGSCRHNSLDPFSDAPQYDRKSDAIRPRMLSTRQEFDALANDSSALGTIGLFSLDHMHYDVDRVREPIETRQPSLKEMASKAMRTLSKAAAEKSSHGFFLMVEGSRIDMAAHSNDPVAHLYDILAYQEMIREVKLFTDEQNKQGWPTLMLSVSDHETGGLSLGKQLDPQIYPEYRWFPDALVNSTTSTLELASRLALSLPASDNQIRTSLAELGVGDPTEDQVRLVQQQTGQWMLDRALASILSDRAEVGWTGHGHSGVDVSLYAFGHLAGNLKGNLENTEVGGFLEKLLSVDLAATTSLLRRTAKAWHSQESSAQSAIGVQHFHGGDALSHGNATSHLYLGEDAPLPATSP